jgi:hypothetical protein
LRGGDQASPQHFLLVFAVEQQESREQILNVPKQVVCFPAELAFSGRHPFPTLANIA